jgi:RNA polymerase sigma-70 factor, ECF subfamily
VTDASRPVANDGSAPPSPPSDSTLVARVLAGDIGAYAKLVDRYRDRLARYATRMLGNREDAEEVLQDSFVRAFRALDRCQDSTRFDRWLFSILINRCRTTGARITRRERVLVDEPGLAALASLDSCDRQFVWRDALRGALAKLETAHREAFLLKHVEDLSYDEMSALTGASVSALKMRVKRACEQLRSLLEEAYQDA